MANESTRGKASKKTRAVVNERRPRVFCLVESLSSIGVDDRYHAPLRGAYNKVREEKDNDFGEHECLRMDIFAVNATVGPEGLCPILLVFGALPRPARAMTAPFQIHRSITIEKAMRDVEKEQER